jgi:hypothetical protein
MSSPVRRLAVLHALCAALRGESDGDGLPVQAPRQRWLPALGTRPATPRATATTGTRRHPVTWEEVLAMAFEQGVGPALWEALRARAQLPPAVGERLREEYRANAVRNLRLRTQLQQAIGALNAAEIEPLLFKGALHLVGGAADVGQRWMSDLDMAVPADALPAACAALEGIGYRRVAKQPFESDELVHARPATAGLIDLHVELGREPISTVLPAADAWARSKGLRTGDGRARGLCAADQVLHNILHGALKDLDHAVRALPLRQLLALARLAGAHAGKLDWDEIEVRMAAGGLESVLRDQLRLADRLFTIAAPVRLRSDPRSRLHERLVLLSFALGWPAELRRNLRWTFSRTYLESLYAHGNRGSRVTFARARHALRLLRREGAGTIGKALRPRG